MYNKTINKKENEELQEYLQFKKRGYSVKPKKEKVLLKEKIEIKKKIWSINNEKFNRFI